MFEVQANLDLDEAKYILNARPGAMQTSNKGLNRSRAESLPASH